MIIVIIAGGSGTRLWPLSTPDYPKQLLSIDGSGQSLLQSTYIRAKAISNKIYVATEASHIKPVRDQLPELSDESFIVEPGRRGTANAILTALMEIGRSNDKDEPIAFIHADHFIKDTQGFVDSINIAANASVANNSIVLVGIKPDYPATGFGYIKKGDSIGDDNIYEVDSFEEKPDVETATKYFQSGDYLWNAGYFVGSFNTFVAKMQSDAPELLQTFETLQNTQDGDFAAAYLELEPSAIDYALIEKVQDLIMVPATFDWVDLGTFGDVHKAIGGAQDGNFIQGKVETEDVTNSLIQNYEDQPVTVIGLDNVVVINTAGGVLVAHKDHSQKVGDVSKRHNNKENT